MKKPMLYISIIFIFFHQSAIAQDIEEKEHSVNSIFIEAGGYGGYGSINYEYLYKKINKIKLSVRIGLSTYHLKDYTNKFNPDIIIPIAINGYYGSTHNIDFSLGQTITNIIYTDNLNFKPKRNNSFNTNLSLGYRYQKETGGLLVKIAYSPIIENNIILKHWVALVLGYAF